MDETKLKAFMYAVKNHYWYQMYVDDLPIWGNIFLNIQQERPILLHVQWNAEFWMFNYPDYQTEGGLVFSNKFMILNWKKLNAKNEVA